MKPSLLQILLVVLLLLAIVFSAGIGPLQISPAEVISILFNKIGITTGTVFSPQQESVLLSIRLPRILFGLFIGATLAVCGAALQGLFRNPLADPGLIGVSSGAALATSITIVLGMQLFGSLFSAIGFYAMGLISFLGAFASTIMIYKISQAGGKTIVSTMLLAGIAVSALSASGTGLITLVANDAQLRTITFWTLGSLGGATWVSLAALAPLSLICIIGLPLMAKSLNALALGESNAEYIGINVEKLKAIIIILTALGVGVSVSLSGIIGFVGLVVPHIVRKLIGPEHKQLFIASALLGAFLLIIADLLCRTIAAPIEIPIGIVTSLIGAPFFLFLLLKERKSQKVI